MPIWRSTPIRGAENCPISPEERWDCYPWCAALAGEYDYPDVPREVYQRHERCRCTVEYAPGYGRRRQDVWTKSWTSPEEDAKIEVRKTYGLENSEKKSEKRKSHYKKLQEKTAGRKCCIMRKEKQNKALSMKYEKAVFILKVGTLMIIDIGQIPLGVRPEEYPKGTLFELNDEMPKRDLVTFRLIPRKPMRLVYPADVEKAKAEGRGERCFLEDW